MTIKNSYLMWVGSAHYESIKEYSDEAIQLGVSKRLPNAAVAREISKPDTVVFVAHDEGETTDCPKCMGEVECWDCRKRVAEMTSLRTAIDTIKKQFKGDWDATAPRGSKRFVETREAKIEALEEECGKCETCAGGGVIRAGTGGKVVKTDGRVWDYRTYNYWLHQPSKFDPRKAVRSVHMCKACGGTGVKPVAKVFGMFVPQDIEYILDGAESEKAMELVKDFTKVTKTAVAAEPRRGCGKRHPGGIYVVTTKKGDAKAAKKAVKELVEKGVLAPTSAEVHGSFVRFVEPIAIDSKRFRGIARFDFSAALADAAEMASDALEAATA